MERVWPEVDRVPQAGRVQPAQGQVWDAASVELATWIISEANQQATEIRHEARDDAATARADAKLQAAKLVQQAADQAAATLAAAELQAARIRAEILKLSADLGGVATSFTEGLLGPAKPATKPAPRRSRAGSDQGGGPVSHRAGGQASHQAGHEAGGQAGPEAGNPVSHCASHEARGKPQADQAGHPGGRPDEKPAGQRGTQGDGRVGGPDLGWRRNRSYGASPARTGLLCLPGQRGRRVADRSRGGPGPGPA